MLENMNLYLYSMFDFTKEILSNEKKQAYFAINTDCYNIASKDMEYKKILENKNNIVYIDGMGIIYGQKITKSEVARERISTTDLFVELLKYSKNNTFYLLGGKPGTTDRLIKNMKIKYPNANFVGSHHGYFDSKENSIVINEINQIKPDFLFVGFGCPHQEKWITDNFESIDAKNFISCGGLFDYYAENVKRAPKWMQKFGLEWLFRMSQEPTRLYKRYLYGNSIFLIKMLYKKLKNEKI